MNFSRLESIIEKLPLDLRAEVVIADLVGKGFSTTDLFIKPVGLFKRRFGKDIAGIRQTELKNNDVISILSVNREGIYDVLPQSVFHNPAKEPKPFKEVSEMVAEVRSRVQEEQAARDFFFAYEIEFFRQRLTLEVKERNLLDTITHNMNDETFLAYWDLPSFFDKRQKGILFYLLPVFHRIRSNFSLMKELYSAMLQQDVRIVTGGKLKPETKEEIRMNTLGKSRLSIDSIVGNRMVNILETIAVEVRLSGTDQVRDFLPESIGMKIIRHLNTLFMPVNSETVINILPPKGQWTLSGSDPNKSRLGFSTFA